jgi:hypothetical protein
VLKSIPRECTTSLASPHAEAWGCAKRLNVASASTVDSCEVEHRVGSHEITVHDNPVGARPVDGMFNYHFFLERENPPPINTCTLFPTFSRTYLSARLLIYHGQCILPLYTLLWVPDESHAHKVQTTYWAAMCQCRCHSTTYIAENSHPFCYIHVVQVHTCANDQYRTPRELVRERCAKEMHFYMMFCSSPCLAH